MEVRELKFADGSGGLNNRDHASQIAQNEFAVLENILTDEGGWPGKKRPGQDLMQYAPIEPSTPIGVLTILALPDGVGPGNIRIVTSSTEGLTVGDRIFFYFAGIIETDVVVTAVLDATTFRVVNTVPYAVGQVFSRMGSIYRWHMDNPGGVAEASDVIALPPRANSALFEEGGRLVNSVPGLFPSVVPLARLCQPATNGVGFGVYGHFLTTNFFVANAVDSEPSVCFQGWFKINPTFTGKPVTVDVTGGGAFFTFSNSGSHLCATRPAAGFGGPGNEGEARNGVTIYRDWDPVNNADASDPYIKFTLRTYGSGKQVLTSKYLPVGVWLFYRCTYNQVTGKIRLRINGDIHAEATAIGLTDDNAGFGTTCGIQVGGADYAQYSPFFHSPKQAFDGALDDTEILLGMTDAEEYIMPFKEPRGKPWALVKANGTRQLIVGAGENLYYTVGDGAWTKMNDAAHDHLGAEIFSNTADWDAVQISDALFLQNGTDAPKMWDGVKLYPWGNPAQPLVLARAAAAAGLNFVGTVDYYVTFLFGALKETGPSPIGQVTTTAVTDQVTFTTIPLGPLGCTGRRIYRKKATGANAGKKYLLREIADNVTTTLVAAYAVGVPAGPTTDTGRDGLSDATLGTGAYTELRAEVEFSLVPKGKYLLANHNRGWIAGIGDEPYAAFYTERDSPHVCLPTNFVRATADSGPLIGLAKYYGEIHASKGGKATLVLRGDNPSNWTQWEVLHPTIGAIDHWSYVHRTTPQSDSYRLCFWAADGAYAYAGQDFEKVSDIINDSTQGLTVDNGNKLAVSVTTRAEWEAAQAINGSATQNLIQPAYATDGTRQDPGKLQIVNQLSYLPLNQPASISGRIIAQEKGPAEGEFLFATDFSNALYRTTDNYVSAVAVAGVNPVPVAERIISIKLRPATQEYYVFTSGVAGVSGGLIYKFEQTGGVWSPVNLTADLFWEQDVPFAATSTVNSSYNNPNFPFQTRGKSGIGQNQTAAFDGSNQNFLGGNNIHLNHAQQLVLSGLVDNGATDFQYLFMDGAATKAGVNTNIVQLLSFPPGPPANTVTHAPGFVGFAGWSNNGTNPVATAIYTRRETAAWKDQAGTADPQAFWAGDGNLWFVAAGAEDSAGHRNARIIKMTAAGARTTVKDTSGPGAVGGHFAMAFQTPTVILYTTTFANAAVGCKAVLNVFTTASPINTFLRNLPDSFLPLRLAATSYWQPGFGASFLFTGKRFQDVRSYEWAGEVTTVSAQSAVFLSLRLFAGSGPNASFPLGIATQISGGNTNFLLVAKSLDATNGTEAFRVKFFNDPPLGSPLSAPNLTDYAPTKPNAASTGATSEPLFVTSSAAAGGYLWADRVYFGGEKVGVLSDGMLQAGLSGDWKVIGGYVSQSFSTGGFSAFAELASDYQGTIDFFLRNASTVPGLAATEQPASPNQNIQGFPTPQSVFQFRLALTWIYNSGQVSISPYTDFVEISYFSGLAKLPRVVAWHWKGRTFWAVAQVGNTANNLVLVYQKSGRWTSYTQWSIKGTAEFLGKLVALQNFELVQLETGSKDLGNLIRTRARTGTIMEDITDKCIRWANFNVEAWVNSAFPTKPGYMKLVPYSAGQRLAADWVFQLPAAAAPEPRQVKCNFSQASFPYQYARAMSLEVLTSDDTGNFAPVVDQVENMASVMLELFVSSPRQRIVRN